MDGRSAFDSRQKTNIFSLLHHQVSETKSPGREPHPSKPTIAKANLNSCSSEYSHFPPPHVFWASYSNIRPYKFTFIYAESGRQQRTDTCFWLYINRIYVINKLQGCLGVPARHIVIQEIAWIFWRRPSCLYFKSSSSNNTKMTETAYSNDSQVPQVEKQRHFLLHLHIWNIQYFALSNLLQVTQMVKRWKQFLCSTQFCTNKTKSPGRGV
jgi:hypothetical protein